jgi:hypothetical protein
MDVSQRDPGGGGLTSLDQLLQQASQGEEATTNYHQLVQTAPPEVVHQAFADTFAQLSVEDRQRIAESLRAANNDPNQAFQSPGITGDDQDLDPQRLADMFSQAQQQQPDLTDSTLGLSGGGGGGGSNPLMQMILSSVATIVMQQLSGAQKGQSTGQGGGGLDLGAILGQVLGGAGGAGGTNVPAGQPGGQSGMGAQPGGGAGGLQDLLGQLAGGGGGGGLGAILGQLASGMQGTGGQQPPRQG